MKIVKKRDIALDLMLPMESGGALGFGSDSGMSNRAASSFFPLDQLTPKGKRMSRKLDDELEEAGCSLNGIQFRELLEERKAITSPSWTIDDLVCHPEEAKAFCQMIRAETSSPKLSDYVILRTLMNVRRSH